MNEKEATKKINNILYLKTKYHIIIIILATILIGGIFKILIDLPGFLLIWTGLYILAIIIKQIIKKRKLNLTSTQK